MSILLSALGFKRCGIPKFVLSEILMLMWPLGPYKYDQLSSRRALGATDTSMAQEHYSAPHRMGIPTNGIEKMMSKEP